MSSSDDHILNDNEATRTPLFMLKTTFCYEWMSVASQTFQIFSQLQSNFPMLILVPPLYLHDLLFVSLFL